MAIEDGTLDGSSPRAGAPDRDDDLPAASSLLSSRWTRDNLVTCHPGRLYKGKPLERIDLESLEYVLDDLGGRLGAVPVGSARMGVFTWDVALDGDGGRFVLQVPVVLDERGDRGRAKAEVPRLNHDNMQAFRARGLTRFVLEPKGLMSLAGNVPAAAFGGLPDHRSITFDRGALRAELGEGQLWWTVSLGPRATADLLAEMVAALVYHYEPDVDGGTALADVVVNDGDFLARRRPDGSFEVRLGAARHLERGIGPSLLLLYLVQLMAYEDFVVGDDLIGLPVLVSNPSVAFEGLARGLRYRCRDLGRPEEAGAAQAERWIRDFGRSPDGRAYRPWAERYLAGRLPAAFGAGADLRERWWRLAPLHTKLAIAELSAHLGPADERDEAAGTARLRRALIDRLSREIGCAEDDGPDAIRINDLEREELLDVLAAARVPAESRAVVADDLLAHWPYRSLDHLLARVPGARGLRSLKARLVFGHVVASADQGTLKSLGPLTPADARSAAGGAPARSIANREVFGGLSLAPSVEGAAARTFPTFEAYMDAALHDPRWGYYGHRVSIGQTGHFNTNPEDLSPHYGRWVATWAFVAWEEMVARGELSEADRFPIVEFGAGNGRLARDILDHLARAAAAAATSDGPGFGGSEPRRQRWAAFAARADYRIYETSGSLRDRQRELLGAGATVSEGDARRPAETLKRDFPGGLRGFVLTNEVPDAFGVHKVILTADGRARAALVVPRVEAPLRETMGQIGGEALARQITDTNAAVRATFGLTENPGDFYLDQAAYGAVMEALAEVPADRRERLLTQGLWFEEAYVPVAAVPDLAAHLRANATEYATALAAEGSGVVVYVNIHASRFMRELGTALDAGFVLTIDYGDTTWGLIQGARRGEFPFRVYGAWQDFQPRPNDPYAAPGTQDLTADVNFTELAAAGRAAGLEVVHFGPERTLIGSDLPDVLRSAADHSGVAEFLGNPVFKVLLLATRPSALFTSPLLSPALPPALASLPLTRREQDVPRSLRSRIPILEKRLRAGAAEDPSEDPAQNP